MNFFAGLALVLGIVTLSLSILSVYKLNIPRDTPLLVLKLLAAAILPWIALVSLVACGLGLFSGSPLLVGLNLLLGGIAAFISIRFIRGVSTPHIEFERAFGPDWRSRIKPELRERLPQRRWPIYMPTPPQPHWKQDVTFWTIPGTERKLLCDIWFPVLTVTPSRLAVIYLHNSGWCLMDKDSGTRTFFRHLCAQGHLVMDVAYRLAPETNMEGMVGDIKRAVVWLKAHASEYGIDPERIVLIGASGGAHLALLAGYTPHHPILTPDDVHDEDLSVRAVISFYGPTDLRAFYDYAWGRSMARWAEITALANRNRLYRYLMPGGNAPARFNFKKGMEALPHLFPEPDKAPEWYTLLSPNEHAQPSCPATLLLQGSGDSGVPLAATQALAEKLRATGVLAPCIVFFQAEHAFDLILPQWSPAAQAAYYDVSHFLALMA